MAVLLGTVGIQPITLGRAVQSWQCTPLPYLPTTTAARFGLALDHDPVTHAAKGLLCEPQATNLLPYSSGFDNAIWSVFGTASKGTANAATAPDGTLTADAIAFTSGAGQVNQYPGVDSCYYSTYAICVCKATMRALIRHFGLRIPATCIRSDLTATTTWQRFSFAFTTVGAGGQSISIANGSARHCGANLLVWGAQLEAGTVATSLHPHHQRDGDAGGRSGEGHAGLDQLLRDGGELVGRCGLESGG